MTWHYQLMKRTEPNGEVWYGVYEFYGMGGYTAQPVCALGDTPEEVVDQLKAMLEDIEEHGVKDYE